MIKSVSHASVWAETPSFGEDQAAPNGSTLPLADGVIVFVRDDAIKPRLEILEYLNDKHFQ